MYEGGGGGGGQDGGEEGGVEVCCPDGLVGENLSPLLSQAESIGACRPVATHGTWSECRVARRAEQQLPWPHLFAQPASAVTQVLLSNVPPACARTPLQRKQ